MTCSICEEFPSLNPLQIRRTRASEVFLLKSRIDDKYKPKKKPRRKVYADTASNWF